MSIREVPTSTFPEMHGPPNRAWWCDEYLVQEYLEADEHVRLTVSSRDHHGAAWVDRIPWDVLQMIKARVGYGDRCAVEVYPADEDLVNVAKMRHLWVLPETPAYVWRRQ